MKTTCLNKALCKAQLKEVSVFSVAIIVSYCEWRVRDLQCCGCNVFHKLVDNLNLFHEMKCYVNPSFNYSDPRGDVGFKYLDMDDDNNNDVFPIF